MVQLKLEYSPEWGGGGQTSVIAIGKDALETLLEKHYTGYEEYAHGFAVEWYLRARHRQDEQKGDIIEIWKYELRSGSLDIDYLNTTPFAVYVSNDAGLTWIIQR